MATLGLRMGRQLLECRARAGGKMRALVGRCVLDARAYQRQQLVTTTESLEQGHQLVSRAVVTGVAMKAPGQLLNTLRGAVPGSGDSTGSGASGGGPANVLKNLFGK